MKYNNQNSVGSGYFGIDDSRVGGDELLPDQFLMRGRGEVVSVRDLCKEARDSLEGM